MRQLTQNEIARTAFKAIPQEQWKSLLAIKIQGQVNALMRGVK